MNWLLTYLVVAWAIRLGMLLAILRRNFAPGAAIAWLLVVFLHPYIGLLLYYLFAQRRLGFGRIAHYQQLLKTYALANAELSLDLSPGTKALVQIASNVGHMPPVQGNTVEFLPDITSFVGRLTKDIDAAQSYVHLLYYIFADDMVGEKIGEALRRAAKRGVKCRVIVDEFASRRIFRGNGLAARLTAAGIEVIGALPTAPLRRRDLRNHRKLGIIDDRIGYAGSHNVSDPGYGGRRGAPWVDVSGRFVGPIVAEMATVFAMDWAFETGQELPAPSIGQMVPIDGGIAMQVVPSGPVESGESYRRLFLGIVESARSELILTTPYFVPDEPTMLALLTARDRGVKVSLVIPELSDNMFTASAGRANYAALLKADVSIFLYRGGLLHSKTITVDERVAIFGSANTDVRSFYLNFESTTLLYDSTAAAELKAMQQSYISHSEKLEFDQWVARGIIWRYIDAGMALISPIL